MSNDDVNKLFDMMADISAKVIAIEASSKAFMFVLKFIILPVAIPIIIASPLFYYNMGVKAAKLESKVQYVIDSANKLHGTK